MQRLDVLLHGRLVGVVTEGNHGRVEFAYIDDHLNSSSPTPLSVSIPLEPGPKNIEAWLDGLLADNDNVRRRWAADYQAKSTKPVDLLATPVGRECAGAVQICRPETTSDLMSRAGILHPLTESGVARIISNLRTDPSGWNRDRSQTAFSLGGAQTKTALRFDGAQWSLAAGSACTTHILKPAAARFPDLDIVEHLCQYAARKLGLHAAETACVYFDDERTLVVTRFDRERLPNGDWARIHQEDACQALAVPPHQKYQNDGGPTPSSVASLIREHSSKPENDVRRFLDAFVYNWLIVNTDAHAKNYGLLLDADDVRFAPLYDLCSFIPYKIVDGEHLHLPKLKMAMKIGNDYTLNKTDRESAWLHVADQLDVSPLLVAERIDALADGLDTAFAEAVDTLPNRAKAAPVVAEMIEAIAVRRVTGLDVARRLQRSYPKPARQHQRLELSGEGEAPNPSQRFELSGECGRRNRTKSGFCKHPHPGRGGRCAAGHRH